MAYRDLHLQIDAMRRLLRRHAKTNLTNLLAKLHPADLAIMFRHLTEEERAAIFPMIPTAEQAAEVLVELDDSIKQELLTQLPVDKIVVLLHEMSADDEAAILRLLPQELQDTILARLKASESQEMEQLMGYPENSAGALMTTEVFALHEDLTVGEAIASIQNQEEQEMVFYLYVIDNRHHLVGVISLRDLITSKPDKKLKDIMITQVHSVHTHTDQEEVAHIVSKYNILAVPVVDDQNKLLGIVTVDDVIDVIREEATEDFFQMAGAGRDREIISKSTMENVKARFPWLFVSWLGGLLVATIIARFRITLQQVLALAAFQPLISGMAGNVGSQTATIIVRGIATGRVELSRAVGIVFKQIRIGLSLGLLYGLLLGSVAYILGRAGVVDVGAMQAIQFGGTVYLGLLLAMGVSATLGAAIPLIMEKLNKDPAIATGPFVATSTDVIALTIFYSIASLFLL